MSEIDVSSARVFSKTIFSMAIPEVMEIMSAEPMRNSVVIFGIETQVYANVNFSLCSYVLYSGTSE